MLHSYDYWKSLELVVVSKSSDALCSRTCVICNMLFCICIRRQNVFFGFINELSTVHAVDAEVGIKTLQVAISVSLQFEEK